MRLPVKARDCVSALVLPDRRNSPCYRDATRYAIDSQVRANGRRYKQAQGKRPGTKNLTPDRRGEVSRGIG